MDEALASDRLADLLGWMQGDLVEMFSDPTRGGELGAAMREIAAPDFVCSMIGGEPGPSSERHGVEGLSKAWEDWLEPWERYDLEIEDVVAADDRIVVLARVRARTKTDGVEVEHAPAAVFSFRDALLVRLEFHLDRRLALAAAGLPQREA
jgi:ketosteroid isomerase-like protein